MKPKPSTGFEVERIPLAMCSARRWLNWRAVERDGKWTKLPCDAERKPVDATDPSNGRTFADCRDAADRKLGIGFMLGDGWLGVDLDGVVDPASGAITDAQVAEWIAAGVPFVREVAAHRDVDYVDLPTGHWPQFTRPAELGRVLVEAVES